MPTRGQRQYFPGRAFFRTHARRRALAVAAAASDKLGSPVSLRAAFERTRRAASPSNSVPHTKPLGYNTSAHRGTRRPGKKVRKPEKTSGAHTRSACPVRPGQTCAPPWRGPYRVRLRLFREAKPIKTAKRCFAKRRDTETRVKVAHVSSRIQSGVAAPPQRTPASGSEAAASRKVIPLQKASECRYGGTRGVRTGPVQPGRVDGFPHNAA